MQTESSSPVLWAALVLILGGVWVTGCGTNASNLFFASGLLLPGVGANPGGGPLPSPGDETADGDDGGDGDTGGQTTVCVTFFNDSDQDARVDFFASDDGTISFQGLIGDLNNLVSLPETDQGCIDPAELTGNLSFVPLILDGGWLSYRIDCVLAASLVFGALDETGVIGTEDQRLGPLRLGVDFNCGDNLNIAITDDDQDEDLEIDFL